jgi:hypothetical protein
MCDEKKKCVKRRVESHFRGSAQGLSRSFDRNVALLCRVAPRNLVVSRFRPRFHRFFIFAASTRAERYPTSKEKAQPLHRLTTLGRKKAKTKRTCGFVFPCLKNGRRWRLHTHSHGPGEDAQEEGGMPCPYVCVLFLCLWCDDVFQRPCSC